MRHITITITLKCPCASKYNSVRPFPYIHRKKERRNKTYIGFLLIQISDIKKKVLVECAGGVTQ